MKQVEGIKFPRDGRVIELVVSYRNQERKVKIARINSDLHSVAWWSEKRNEYGDWKAISKGEEGVRKYIRNYLNYLNRPKEISKKLGPNLYQIIRKGR